MRDLSGSIAFQGELGAYSHQACIVARPEYKPVPHGTFEDAVAAVVVGRADLAMLPIENSIYGRVADIHHLLPDSGLFIIDELLMGIRINLLGVPGTGINEIKTAMSHTVLLGQCRKYLRSRNIRQESWADTAGAAKHVSALGDRSRCALASELAGQIYNLEVIKRNIEDESSNRTRFVLMSRSANREKRSKNMMTAFVFQVRNIPAALYKSLGGFATNNVNMVKLESYMIGGSFSATQFFAEIEGHPDDYSVSLALQELEYFTSMMRIVGIYPASAERLEANATS